MNDEKVKEALWNRIFFDFCSNVSLLPNGMFSKSPITEHYNDKTDKIYPQHPYVHIGWGIFAIFILFYYSGIETSRWPV